MVLSGRTGWGLPVLLGRSRVQTGTIGSGITHPCPAKETASGRHLRSDCPGLQRGRDTQLAQQGHTLPTTEVSARGSYLRQQARLLRPFRLSE